MDPQQQFCHNPDCSERGVVGGTRFDLLLAGKQAVLAGAEREAQPCRGWCPAGSGAVGSTAEARGT